MRVGEAVINQEPPGTEIPKLRPESVICCVQVSLYIVQSYPSLPSGPPRPGYLWVLVEQVSLVLAEWFRVDKAQELHHFARGVLHILLVDLGDRDILLPVSVEYESACVL